MGWVSGDGEDVRSWGGCQVSTLCPALLLELLVLIQLLNDCLV